MVFVLRISGTYYHEQHLALRVLWPDFQSAMQSTLSSIGKLSVQKPGAPVERLLGVRNVPEDRMSDLLSTKSAMFKSYDSCQIC